MSSAAGPGAAPTTFGETGVDDRSTVASNKATTTCKNNAKLIRKFRSIMYIRPRLDHYTYILLLNLDVTHYLTYYSILRLQAIWEVLYFIYYSGR